MSQPSRLFIGRTLVLAALAFCQSLALAGPIQFGLHIHRLESVGWPNVPFASIRLSDAGVRWGQVETAAGSYQWDRLDNLVATATANHVSILYPLAVTPMWASSRPGEHGAFGNGTAAMPRANADWVTFVRAVVQRYQGRIQAYEIWNEPSETGFFSGSPADMAELVRLAAEAIRAGDPAARVVCPAAVGKKGLAWLRSFAAVGGLKSCDVAAFHFYTTPQSPEASLPAIDEVQAIIATYAGRRMPLWNTEFGWYVERPEMREHGDNAAVAVPEGFKTPVPQAIVAAYIARAYLLDAWKGIERAYYYAWDNDEIGLSGKDGNRRISADGFGVVSGWSIGRTIDSCRREATFIECLACKSGTCHRVMWAIKGQVSVPLTNAGTAGSVSTFDLVTGVTAKTQLDAGQLRLGANPTEILD